MVPLIFLFFDGWDCVPVSLFVWPEVSSRGISRRLVEPGLGVDLWTSEIALSLINIP